MPDIFSFLNYLNTNGKETTYSKIIIYLITHFPEIQSLTISEVGEKCFVSAATMTRFCKHFGFSSFGHLRNTIGDFGQIKASSSLRMKEKELKELNQSPADYLTSYGAEIASSINDVIETIDIEAVDDILEALYQAEEVVVIGYSATLELAKALQSSFLFSGKLLYVGETENIQKQLVDQLGEKSIIIVISSYGTLLNRSGELMRKINTGPATSILVTQHTQNTLTNLFDFSINVTTTNYVRIGNYPLSFFLDYFVRRYASLYSNKIFD